MCFQVLSVEPDNLRYVYKVVRETSKKLQFSSRYRNRHDRSTVHLDPDSPESCEYLLGRETRVEPSTYKPRVYDQSGPGLYVYETLESAEYSDAGLRNRLQFNTPYRFDLAVLLCKVKPKDFICKGRPVGYSKGIARVYLAVTPIEVVLSTRRTPRA